MKTPDELVERRAAEILKLLAIEDREVMELWGNVRERRGYAASKAIGCFVVIYILTFIFGGLVVAKQTSDARAEGWCAHQGMAYDDAALRCIPGSTGLYSGTPNP